MPNKIVNIIMYVGLIISMHHTLIAQSIDKDFDIYASKFKLSVDASMHIKLVSLEDESSVIMNDYQPADYLIIDGNNVDDFKLTQVDKASVEGVLGKGTQWIVSGNNFEYQVAKKTTYTFYHDYPGFIFSQTEFENIGNQKHLLNSWVANQVTLSNEGHTPPYYGFQGSSTSARQDWVRPIEPFYYDKNYMGMNNSDYGGGIPIVDLWRPDIGVAIGHAELSPELVSFPTELRSNQDDASVSMMDFFEYPHFFEPNDSYVTPLAFYYVHSGDYFQTLSDYSDMMQGQGLEMAPSQPDAYESIWCAWGYERKFTKEEVLGTLDKVQEMGIKWVVVDDGFQIAEGDWNLNLERFPRGNVEMKELVDDIHDRGLKAKIWWTPLAADPHSKVLKEAPKAYLFSEEWAPRIITWWDAYYLSPTHPATVAHTKETLDLFLNQWGFDGLKMDGQHMNAVPPDHNPDAGIEDASLATKELPEFFQMIYDESVKIKPNAVIENCPCGTCMSYFNMKSMNQAVSSDPLSSWQVRHKGKTYKALVPHVAYYGDHVELSDEASDFASSMGIGAVLGTKFTYPKDNPHAADSYLLTPEKEVIWKKWFKLYDEHMISKGNYLGTLYDIGYDKPETHVVSKNNGMYYAFYADEWDAPLEFRGLDSNTTYRIFDYVNNRVLGYLKNGETFFNAQFTKNLLVQLTPVKNK